ncbi:hypothetical protein LEP1GSC116_1924 [Leptospira interrogans serovar Icterohaemorrhagiae str. Verdun HP]|uniref:Uncharacterized protein n=2 Tax=Leptospira interrogans TaxID=173 RepID=M3I193_LEPIR|nr:hypothetical protein LEP1GSC151_5633 [Leptospira interrogans serovar Grippotyphosa str. LT2186]EMO05973.1 hypothetical protein LEP1GSC116_1924 [Leptospira interrogans serovar Icterohaemorrhagiae str. Verdun HP]
MVRTGFYLSSNENFAFFQNYQNPKSSLDRKRKKILRGSEVLVEPTSTSTVAA